MKNVFKPITVAVMVSTIALTGCMGKFALTDKIYTWNEKATGDRWGNEIVFLAFIIIPVYSITLLADGIIFNSIDWWTGKNPIAAGDTKEVRGEDGSIAQMTMRTDGAIDVAVTAAGGQQSQFTLVRDGDAVRAVDAQGKAMDMVTL